MKKNVLKKIKILEKKQKIYYNTMWYKKFEKKSGGKIYDEKCYISDC